MQNIQRKPKGKVRVKERIRVKKRKKINPITSFYRRALSDPYTQVVLAIMALIVIAVGGAILLGK